MTRKNKVRLGDLIPALDLLNAAEGDTHRSLEIHRIATVEKAREGDLVFVAQESLLAKLQKSAPSAAVISDSYFEKAAALGFPFPLLRVKDAMLAFAKASAFFKTETTPPAGVHPTAFVHPSARLGANVIVGPHAVIGEEAEIENDVVIHASAEVGARVRLGAETVIFPGVVIYQDVKIGARVRIHANSVIGADGFGYVQEKTPTGVKHVKIHHLGGVQIGDDVEIGASTTIDRGTLEDTILEKGCIIDNQVQIGHNCHLEEGVIICGCTGLAGSVHVGKFAVLAGFVGVANKMKIGAGARVAAYTAIQGHVPPGVTWGGIPGMPHRNWLRTQLLFEKLPELLEQRKKRGTSE
ncbi:MAG: UDP-3-O-(3-hydroxymyristoyl)glucosamine N-acyltransferase [Bdellovibrionota bacterium]